MRFILRQLKRTAVFFLLVAAAFLAAIPVTFLYMRIKFEQLKKQGIPEGAEYPCPDEAERDMEDVFEKLNELSFEPARPMALGFLKGGLTLNFLFLMNAKRATACRMYRYPAEFEEVFFESFDGTPLCAAIGLHTEGIPRPGIVISHGLMGSKNDHNIMETALTAFAGWGYNVLCIDLRNCGKSQCLSHAPTTAGWKEGEDILAAAKYLGEQPGVTTVGVIGFSMGAGCVMRSAYMAGEYPYITGGAIAMNGFSDSRRMVEYLDCRPPVTDPFYGAYLAFGALHKLRHGDMRKYVEDSRMQGYLDAPHKEAGFVKYVSEVSAPFYGVTEDELYRNSSSRDYLADVEVPLLIVHSADDPVIPPSEMDDLADIAEANPNIKIWMLPAGSHVCYMYMDRNWYDAAIRRYFDYWATWQ